MGSGFKNDTMLAQNVNFTNVAPGTPTMTTNGQLIIGHTALNAGGTHIDIGNITSPLGTLTVGYSNPNITLDLAGGSTGIDSIGVQTGTSPVLPNAAGLLTFNGAVVAAGTNPVRTDGTGPNTLALEVQTSQALAAADATKIGLSNFNSTSFTVAATGFVSLATSIAQLYTANTGTATPSANNLNVLGGGGIQTAGSGATLTIAVSGGGFTWVDATGATQSLAVQTGYVTDHSATVVYTLPATAVLGDTIKIVGKLGLATITPNANQQILLGSTSGAVGATGTAVSTNVGDCIELIAITAGASTVWRADSVIGTWVITT